MDLQIGDIVTLKSDTGISFTLGDIYDHISGVKYARIYWFSRLEFEMKVFDLPLDALAK